MNQTLNESTRDFQGIWFPAPLWKDRTLSMTQKVILLEVRSFQKHGMACFVSNEHLADLCGVSCSAIEKALQQLVQRAHLKRWTEYNGKKRTRLMTVLHPQMWEHPQPAVAPNHSQLREPTTASCGTYPQPAEAPTHSQLRNNSTIEQNKEQTKGKKESTPNSIEDVKDHFRKLLVPDAAGMAEDFWNYYESNGWHVGKNKMKSWRAAASRWNKQNQKYNEERTAKGRGYAGVNSADLATAIRNQTS